jgi:hypothetical protein
MNTGSYISVLAALLLASTPLQAQWELGVQAGAGTGRINTDLFPATSRGEYQVVDQRFSWLLGVTATHKLSGILGFSSALYWSSIGGHDEYWSRGVKITTSDRRIHYLCIPLLLRADIGRFGFGLGYQLGTPVAQKGTFNRYPYADGSGYLTTQETNDLNLKRTDFGVVGELSFRITDRIGAGARYYYGLQNIKDPSDGYIAPWMNEQLVLTLSYQVFAKRKAKPEETPVQPPAPAE